MQLCDAALDLLAEGGLAFAAACKPPLAYGGTVISASNEFASRDQDGHGAVVQRLCFD
ncbi:hypothetical protein ABQW67_13835 [Xanthomonas hortorum]|uniref:Uncharacterized protein n=1 Tax=Xanthomonas hortorum pv. vitians TaxID=83224 RepID=A0AAW8ZPP5_9XANT|nr:hypothetical protein [Xanthomonas hortorum]EGD20530.1 hypothetical protein XGA_0814 [Xanthomonas hortorum ATCC 19865]MDT7819392.1 hypothetical protein [Xanthomonas hortorum pv. vitians]MDT7823425.1 hypothetical protein [Xanthomonas hortorum pv. vitians]MDT7852080.1 hypothetical protein [Xanthomonas hortorum pv. vitians]MDV7247926.1 hypothetical protein [Xanthomonas hortorum pv. vitians]